jgi:hypothetical protein
MRKTTGSAPNYTKACIYMFGVNLSWIFVAIWALWGLLAVAVTGWCINRAIRYLEARQG